MKLSPDYANISRDWRAMLGVFFAMLALIALFDSYEIYVALRQNRDIAVNDQQVPAEKIHTDELDAVLNKFEQKKKDLQAYELSRPFIVDPFR